MKTTIFVLSLLMFTTTANALTASEALSSTRERLAQVSASMPAGQDFRFTSPVGSSRGKPCEVDIFGGKDSSLSMIVHVGDSGTYFDSSFGMPVKKFTNNAKALELRLYSPGKFNIEIDKAEASVNEHFKMEFDKAGKIKSISVKNDPILMPASYVTCSFK